MTLDWRTLPSIIAPPAKLEDHGEWLDSLKAARMKAGADLGLANAPVSRPELAWANDCFVCAKWMTWDRRFQEPRSGRLLPGKFLQDGRKRFGGYDGVVLWQAYPRIGFDARNQYDFYRDLPGGVSALKEVIEELSKAGVRTFLAYNPWDVGTRRASADDGLALRELADEVGAHGIFLDTLRSGGEPLRKALLEGPRPMALESELDLPPDALGDHALSWMQWPNPPDLLGVLRNHWLSPTHMQHVIRRWHRSHRHELQLAWLNGVGMLVWENVFSSWNGWTPEDARYLRAMRETYRAHRELFQKGEWAPLVPVGETRLKVSTWRKDGKVVFTVANPTMEEQAIDLPAQPLFGAWPEGKGFRVEPRALAAFADFDTEGIGLGEEPVDPKLFIQALPLPRSVETTSEFGMAEVDFPGGVVTQRVRVRECGDYGYARFDDVSYPGLHQIVPLSKQLPVLRFAVDIEEVTNAQYLAYLRATGRRRLPNHWQNGHPVSGSEHQPVVFVNLDEARGYAQWAGKRLPTEWEWQIAAAAGKISRGSPLVWNWTESEHSDGMTDFVMLKGGCEMKVVGSDWYADGGPQEPDFVAKFIRIGPELDRCATIGFRCARDLG